MRHFGNYYLYRTNNPECKELIEKIINRYGLNIGLDMHQKIYLVDDNFVADKIKNLMAIQGEIGLTIKVGLFSGLREDEIVYIHDNEICSNLGGCIATQRIAYLNTNALQQLHTYFVGTLPRPYDRNLVSNTFTIDQGILEKTLEFAPGEWLLSATLLPE